MFVAGKSLRREARINLNFVAKLLAKTRPRPGGRARAAAEKPRLEESRFRRGGARDALPVGSKSFGELRCRSCESPASIASFRREVKVPRGWCARRLPAGY